MTLSVKIVEALMRKIAPAGRGRTVSPEDEAAISPLLPKYHKFEAVVVLPLVAAAIGASAAALWWAERRWVGPTGPTIYSERNGLLWAAAPMFAWLGLSFVLCRVLARLWWGGAYGLYDRLLESRRGINARREHALYALVFVTIGLAAGIGTWGMGTVIDRGGVTYKDTFFGWGHRPLAEVRSVTFHRRVDAPIGIVDRPSVRIEFAGGEHVDLEGNRRDPPARFAAIAALVAKEAGVELRAEDVRPR